MVAPKPYTVWLSSCGPWALAVFIGTFLFYLPSLQSGFVYDAQAQIINDSYIHDAGHFSEVLTLRVMAKDVMDSVRPVHLFFLMADAFWWKLQPFGYHLTSVLFHCLNSTLVFLLLVQLAGPSAKKFYVPALCAFVFALHPVNVETVAEVTYREDLLVTCFLLISWLLAGYFGRWQGVALWGGGVGIFLACLLAAGSKETGFVSPILLGLYWFLFRWEDSARRWTVLLAFVFLAVAAFVTLRFMLPPAQSQIFLTHPAYLGGSLTAVFTIQPWLWAFLIKSIYWPVSLSADYVPQNVVELGLLSVIFILGVFVSLQLLLAWRSRVAAFGVAIVWLGLAPVSNFTPLFRPMADRFLYLPMVGIALLIFAVLSLVPERVRRYGLLVLSVGILALAILSWQRQPVFANPLNLWLDTLAKSPHSVTAADNLGYAWLEQAEYEKALEAYEKALHLTGGHLGDAWAGAAIALEKLGRYQDAERSLQNAVREDAVYASPDRLIRALLTTRENADILAKILARMPPKADPPAR